LGGINKLSTLVANLLEQIQNQQNQGSGSGGMSSKQMMEQLQEMGENQQQLNQQIQDMINDIQGERLREDQMERLDQLSRQQNEIRKQLQELQQGGGMEGGDELGSELERMIEQMEETINDLRGGAVDPTLIERQQNILSRMLQAEDALQEREEEERREGEAANEFERVTPPEITLEELEMQIRNRLNDPDFTKYAPDYQRLIEKYFELLKEVQQREIQ
jgi:DNA repair exonuclease SbcCD ATPase subunit